MVAGEAEMLATWLTTLMHLAISRGADDERLAVQLYDRARRAGRLGRIWAALGGRPARLARLANATAGAAPLNRHAIGLRTVPIRQIGGSEARWRDFDADFHPLLGATRDRWLRLATARLRGRALPPVELIAAGSTYYVRDGHHRLSVARVLGEDFIEAHVTVWQLPRAATEARIEPTL